MLECLKGVTLTNLDLYFHLYSLTEPVFINRLLQQKERNLLPPLTPEEQVLVDLRNDNRMYHFRRCCTGLDRRRSQCLSYH